MFCPLSANSQNVLWAGVEDRCVDRGLGPKHGPLCGFLGSCWPLWQGFCFICSLAVLPLFPQSWETWWTRSSSWAELASPRLALFLWILRVSTTSHLWIRLFISAWHNFVMIFTAVPHGKQATGFYPSATSNVLCWVSQPTEARVLSVAIIPHLPFAMYIAAHLLCAVVSSWWWEKF